jgi:PleD family two-component response regulator
VTVSIDVALSWQKTVSYQEFVENAETALYQAKRSGKNRVLLVVDGEVLIQ